MENFENENIRPESPDSAELNRMTEENRYAAEPRSGDPVETGSYSAYRGEGVGRKESPFADSPYVVNRQPEPRNEYQIPRQAPAAEEKPKVRRRRGLWRPALAVLLTVALVAGCCGITAAVVNSRWEAETGRMNVEFSSRMEQMQAQIDAIRQQSQMAPIGPAAITGMTPGQVYAQNVNSVVLIGCEVTSNAYGQPTTGTSAGSGFVLTENGYVVTNHHVVEGATRIYVTTFDGSEYEAKLVGSDATNDVAVLKVEAEGLDPVVIGSSGALLVGDQVVAIGNPLGELTSTMTAGYVSAKNRDVTTDGRTINMIQTDAAINSGNSGGPLFNMKGEVVGITTAKYSGSSASGATIEGIGFAIPMDDVVGMIDDLVNFGYVTGAYLGVMVSDMDPEAASYYGMPVGAYVQEVTPGHCAEAAGLQAKDIIVALGDYEVKNVSSLTRALRNFRAGATTTITVFRGGKEVVLTITLDEKPAATQTQIPAGDNPMPEDGSYEEWYNYFYPFFGNKD